MPPARGVPVWRLSAPMRNVSVFICEMLVFRVIKKGCPQPRGSFFEVARPYATCKFCSYSKCKLFRGKQPHIRNPLCCISRKKKAYISQKKQKTYISHRGKCSSVCLFVAVWFVGCGFGVLFLFALLRCETLSTNEHKKPSTKLIIFKKTGHKNQRTKLFTLY